MRVRTDDGPGCDVAVAGDEHVRHLLHLGVADLGLHALAAGVDLDAQAGGAQLGCDLVAVLGVAVGDRDQRRLYGRQPDRESAGVVLDEDGHEALDGAEDGAMDHHRPLQAAVFGRVMQVEALRQVEVELDRC